MDLTTARARIHALLPILDNPTEADAREAELDQRIDTLLAAFTPEMTRAAHFTEAARLLEDTGRDDDAVNLLDNVADGIRTHATAETDTLPQWLYRRIARHRPNAPAWDALTEDDQSYWAHEAAAVRRAVARNGFKPA